MTNHKKRKRQVDLTQEPIDLTGDDESEEVKSLSTSSSSSKQSSVKKSNSSSLTIFSSSSLGSDTEIDVLADIFMKRVKSFSLAAKSFLNKAIISQMIFAIAEDSFIKNMLHLRASLYETAVAFDNQNAITALREFRLQHLPALLSSQRYQASPWVRDKPSETIFAEIDKNNAKSALEKYHVMGAAEFLEDFFSDYVTELGVSHKVFAADILQHSAFQIGKAFADRKIMVPPGKRNDIAAIFIGYAAELGHLPANEWIELRGKNQAARRAPGSSSSSL